MQHDLQLRAAARAIYYARYPIEDRSHSASKLTIC